jgi:hypothetical protein
VGAEELDIVKTLNAMFHDNVVVMQAAWIEWRYGAGAEAAMQWIENTLEGPGLIPDEQEPYADDAQRFFDLNRSSPFPACAVCGIPSHVLWMGKGFCSNEHADEFRAANPRG